jgi:hypothetical protein
MPVSRTWVLAFTLAAGGFVSCSRAPQQRTLTERQRAALLDVLKRYEGRVVGIYGWAHPEERVRLEREHYAGEFAQVFRQAGWKYAARLLPRMETDFAGIIFMTYAGSGQAANPDFAPLREAFDRAEIRYREMRVRNTDFYLDPVSTLDPVIYIGAK